MNNTYKYLMISGIDQISEQTKDNFKSTRIREKIEYRLGTLDSYFVPF